jgi:hypothetical protein
MCLPDSEHAWKRFAIPSGTAAILDREFLPDPDDEYGAYSNTLVRAFSSLRDKELIVLLGDSGLGKSDVFAREASAINSENTAGHIALFCRVSDYISTQQIQTYFDSQPFQQWLAGRYQLSLFIDGLDEGLLRGDEWRTSIRLQAERWAETVVNLDGATSRPIDRLRLRISCRPGLWPSSFGEDLTKVFWPLQPERSETFRWDLLPLREQDVQLAAQDHGLTPNDFLTEVARAGAYSFAASPLSLKLLFQIRFSEAKLPTTHVEMFRKGCVHLAEEHNSRRRDSTIRPRVTAHRRLLIARRIAAMSVFCGKSRISRPAATVTPQDDTVLDASSVRGSLTREDVSQAELQETLDCGLFTFQDEATVRWAHGAFAAFLAAEWSEQLGLSLRDLSRLVTVISGNETGVPDQVRSAAAWICELYPALQKEMLQHSPLLLLSLDGNAIDASLKPATVRAVIRHTMSLDATRGLMRAGNHFNYAGIATQLRPYIRSKRRRSLEQRHRAMDLVIACKTVELSTALAELALDQSEPRILRRSAAFAVSEFGTPESRIALLPLARTEEPSDSQDLKGWALAANWPGTLSAQDVFALFTPQSDRHFHGGYDRFLYHFGSTLGGAFTVADLVPAFAWANQVPVFDHNFALDRIVHAIIMRACDSYADGTTTRLLAELLVNRVRAHGEAVPRETLSRGGATEWEKKSVLYPDLRPTLLKECLDVIATPDRATLYRIGRFFRLSAEDVPLLQMMTAEDPLRYGSLIAELLTMLGSEPIVCLAIYQGVQQRHFDPQFLNYLRTDIGTPAAEMEKEDYERPILQREDRQRQLREGWDAFRAGLSDGEHGNANGWTRIWETLWILNPDKESLWEGSPNLDLAPGWKELDDPTKTQIANIASSFALTATQVAFDFLAGGPFSRWIVYIYSSVLLSLKSHWQQLQGVDDATWELWTVLAFWFPFGQSETEWSELVNLLSGERPQPFLAGLRRYITASLEGGQEITYSLRRHVAWPPETETLIFDTLSRPNLTVSQWASLVDWGIGSFPTAFGTYLLKKIRGTSVVSRDDRELLVRAVILLMRNGKGDPWEEMYPIFLQQPEIGCRVAGELQDDSSQIGFLSRMSDLSIGLFYVWLRRNVGGAGAELPRSGAVGPEFHTRMLVDRTFTAMLDRGNLAVFRYISQAFPEDSWMRFHHETVLQISLRKSWKPFTPAALLLLETKQGLPWYQTEGAFIGVFLLSSVFSVAVAEAFNSGGSRWLSGLAGIVVGSMIVIGYMAFVRSRRSLLNTVEARSH